MRVPAEDGSGQQDASRNGKFMASVVTAHDIDTIARVKSSDS